MDLLGARPVQRAAPGLADSAVVAALVAGDESAFVSLIDQWAPLLSAVAVRMTGRRETAAQLLTGTWRRALESLRAFREPPGLRALLMRALLDEARAAGVLVAEAGAFQRLGVGPTVASDRFRDPDDPEWPGHWSRPPEPWPDITMADRAETELAVEVAVAALPEPQRLVVALRDCGGCSVEEVARIIAVSPGQARNLLHRARAVLRQALEARLEVAS